MLSKKHGCWSCRARRKRCDGRTPCCNTCDRLGIDCAGFGTSRPSWMDGGAGQRAYCGWLKTVVKSARRQQCHTRKESYSGESNSFSQAQQTQQLLAIRTSPKEVDFPDTVPYQPVTPGTASPSLETYPLIEQLLVYPSDGKTETELFSPVLDEGHLSDIGCNTSNGSSDSWIAEARQDQPLPLTPAPEVPDFLVPSQGNADCDWHLLMRYFDCTMQRLFPFHCPVEHVDERGHLLYLVYRSSLVRTALMSAVSYDLERVPHPEAGITTPTWLLYYQQASEMIMSELESLFNNKDHTSRSCIHSLALEALVSLVHLLLLGLVVNDTNATNTRFDQGCQLLEILDSSMSFQAVGPHSRVQAFFTCVFLRWLVFRGTAQPQRLSWFSLAGTLQRLPEGNLCGYATSLLEAISQIAELAVWKNSSAAAGVLSTLELAKRAHTIEAKVTPFVELGRWQPHHSGDRTSSIDLANAAGSAQGPSRCCPRGYDCDFRSTTKATSTAVTLPSCTFHAYRQNLANALLARSAQIFLHIVLSGPNPRLLEIQAAMQSSVQLLRQHKEMVGCMALSWPLAMMASMAVGFEEREILSEAITAGESLWAYPDEQGRIEMSKYAAID